jgi:hypothetical protein
LIFSIVDPGESAKVPPRISIVRGIVRIRAREGVRIRKVPRCKLSSISSSESSKTHRRLSRSREHQQANQHQTENLGSSLHFAGSLLPKIFEE